MFIRPILNNEVIVELESEAFIMRKPKISIQFTQDAQKQVFIKGCDCMRGCHLLRENRVDDKKR